MKILWIPHASWHIPQRAHLFCRALAVRHDVHVTDWIADFASARDYLSKRYLRSITPGTYRDGNISVHRVPRISPALPFARLRRLNTMIYSRAVQRLIDKLRIEVVVGTYVVPPPKAPHLVFDLFDDNAAFWREGNRHQAYANEIEQVEQEYLRVADAVVAASSVLADKARALGATASVHEIPNGVDLSRFESVDREQMRRRMNLHGTVVGSIGNHDSTHEVDKMLTAARLLEPDGLTMVIAGRGSASRHAEARIRDEGITNVVLHGYVPPEQAAGLVAALDVGICPYARSPMDDARSPMRLLMYSAAGVPAVSTSLEELRRLQLPNVVLVEDNASALAEGIRTALTIPRVRTPQIQEFSLDRVVARYERVLMAHAGETQ